MSIVLKQLFTLAPRFRLTLCILCCLISFAFFLEFQARKLHAQNATQIVRKVYNHLSKTQRFRVKVNILRPNSSTVTGLLSYDHGKMNFHMSNGNVIASNNFKMIAYNAAKRVAGSHSVDTEKKKGGIAWLLSDYNYVINGKQSAIGFAKKSSLALREVQIKWDKNYILTDLELKKADQQPYLRIKLSEYRTLSSFSPMLFSFRPPTGSRTVENVFNR